ncbi:MAG: hypothetical protein PHY09_00875 [Desulfuromonadaceae bacterium]|nr:hypothetical protein [Desulfuromonadaceae bacterium]MDD5104868.1 hypothetical protein [Desulfuromonadaceae bacterium]
MSIVSPNREIQIIQGGYILLARKIFDSELMNKPPHYLKLWLWLLCRAFWKDGDILKRGQLHTSISEMQNVGLYKNGNQRVGRLTVDQVRAAYNWFVNCGMISIAKPANKMTITVLNFDSYQNPELYGSHKKADTEANKPANTRAKPTSQITQHTVNTIKNNQKSACETQGEHRGGSQSETHTIEKKVLKEVKTLKHLSDFDTFWKAYPRKKNEVAAAKAWKKLDPDPELVASIMSAVACQSCQQAWQKEGGKFIPHASTWLNNRRWEDETTSPSGGRAATSDDRYSMFIGT